ncbi:condensin subunit Smc [Marininema mesophilum]|uniref:Chromosome partition protein Smc n=1 Tax=Marininema mesophilum TaxID=1048340 RepID=A0A1H2Q2A2_9BACL|nr:chromosome segregation protein SMC [Marininema mesophilum]SDW00948.1 condensin subunit Smc [Marininema mesophilum]
MHLKRLDIVGFKSFANRTELEFVPGVTAVVGPNGSGKSNVTDGMRWVLGEQSAKSLRGASMQDVIFSGSDSRKPVGYCEVAITFDNNDQRLGIDYAEVTVARRVYRSGESEYYINKQACRLRDITELFMDTGIGKEAYSMIGQGRIDEILSTKSEDRRVIFEEAAGIVKYKSRKREAEKKLDASDQNLSRIQDLVSELEDQVAPLTEQAEKAKQYKKLKTELTQTEIGLYVHRIETLHQNWQKADETLGHLREKQALLAADVSSHEAELEKIRWMIGQKERQVESLQGELLQRSEELEKTEGQREVLMERSRNRVAAIDELNERIQTLTVAKNDREAEWKQQQERLVVKETELADIQGKLDGALERFAASVDRGVTNLDDLKQRLSTLLNERTRLDSESRHIQEQYEQAKKNEEELIEREEKEAEKASELQGRKEWLDREQAEVENALEVCTTQMKELVEDRRELEKSIQEAATLLRQAEQKLDNLRSRREIVKDMEAGHAGFFQGVKEILKAWDRGATGLAGLHGAVAQLIQVPAEVEVAVETALGGAMQHLVAANEATARAGIRYLKEQRAGRATFLPLDVIKGRFFPGQEKAELEQMDGFVGIAADLVKCEQQYRKVVLNLLGQVVVARTLEQANGIARRLSYRYRIVTLDGEVVNPGGSMTGGSQQKTKNNLLGRSRQVEELEKEVVVAQSAWEEALEDHKELLSQQQELDEELEDLREEGEALRHSQQELKGTEREWMVENRTHLSQQELTRTEKERLVEELTRIRDRQTELSQQTKESEAEEDRLKKSIHVSQEQVEQHASEMDAANKEITDWKIGVARLTQEQEYLALDCERLAGETAKAEEAIQEAHSRLNRQKSGEEDGGEEARALAVKVDELREQKESIQSSLTRAKEERDASHSNRGEREAELKTMQQGLRKHEEELHQQEVRANRLDVELNHLLEKLAEEYEVSYELAKTRYERPEDPKQAEREVRSYKGKIASLGEVNLGAIEEHGRLTTRLNFLIGQRDDLLQAKETLKQVIRDIEAEMSSRFSQTFEAIRVEFTDVFAKMFGGGQADLRLTEPDNLLETGIEITAQPPGKKPQNLALLSGGERALAAIALLFAVLRYKPVPFCVLDEVDAALDEANLSRFTSYLREFSQKTQFIIITHRKRTMEGADVMYGITMEEAGVSKIVSVKLEDFDGEREVAAAKE